MCFTHRLDGTPSLATGKRQKSKRSQPGISISDYKILAQSYYVHAHCGEAEVGVPVGSPRALCVVQIDCGGGVGDGQAWAEFGGIGEGVRREADVVVSELIDPDQVDNNDDE
jgi:hypothetical protein